MRTAVNSAGILNVLAGPGDYSEGDKMKRTETCRTCAAAKPSEMKGMRECIRDRILYHEWHRCDGRYIPKPRRGKNGIKN